MPTPHESTLFELPHCLERRIRNRIEELLSVREQGGEYLSARILELRWVITELRNLEAVNNSQKD